MGVASTVFEWVLIAPHATVGVWVQGYSPKEFVTFCITAHLRSNVPSGAVDVKALMSIADTGPHVDGTVGRTVWVTNNTVGPQPYITCKLNDFTELLQN